MLYCFLLLQCERIQIIAAEGMNIVIPIKNVNSSKPINIMAIPNPVCILKQNNNIW